MADLSRPGTTVRRTVHELDGAAAGRTRPDSVVTEEPMEIRLGWPGQPATRTAVVMRTPGNDFELAAGFLLAEGALGLDEPPSSVAYCLDRELSQQQLYNVVTVMLAQPPLRSPARRSTAVSSACGVCGTESLEEVFAPTAEKLTVTSPVRQEVVSRLPDLLRAEQSIFARTGAVHAAGVFSYAGDLLVAREDIGRHSAVDKVLGARVLGSATYGEDAILCVSGRIGFDIITKALAGRISMVAAVGGPSSLALQLAERAGITVCGFVRAGRLVIYTGPDRIVGAEH